MANNDGNIVKRASQYIDNIAFDETTQLPMTQIAGTDGSNVYRVAVDANGALAIAPTAVTERYDYAASTLIYTATAPIGTADSSLGWTITKFDLSDGSNASGKVATDVSWNNRATGSFA